jgi:hypothetical protein
MEPASVGSLELAVREMSFRAQHGALRTIQGRRGLGGVGFVPSFATVPQAPSRHSQPDDSINSPMLHSNA